MKNYIFFIAKVLATAVLLSALISVTGCRDETTDESEAEPVTESNPEASIGIDMVHSVAYPGVISDGTGGALVVYDELAPDNTHEMRIQRINQSGKSMWGKEGILLGEGFSFFGDYLKLVSDGSGGAITTAEIADENGPWVETIFRIDSQGDILWRTSLPVNRRIEEITADGMGGAIFCWRDSRQQDNCYIQKVNSQGRFSWDEEGVLLRRDNYQFGSLRLVSDGSGGAIIAWHELENDSGSRVCAQRVDADGNLLWEGESIIRKGKVLYTTSRITDGQQGKMISDGSGGAFLTWIESNRTSPELYEVIAIRVDSAGGLKWESHVKLDTGLSVSDYVAFPFIIGDGTGNVILFWSDVNTIYAQKLGTSGEPLWPNNGIVVWKNPANLRLASRVIGDDSGGAFIAWNYLENNTADPERKLRIQKLDSEGITIWDPEGISVDTAKDTFATLADLVPDGEGGVLITWTTGTEISVSQDSYVQKINGEGSPIWEEGGIRLGLR